MTPNPFLSELMTHKWAMEEEALKAFFEVAIPSLIEQAGTSKAVNKTTSLNITDGIATIKISGVLLKSVPAWLRYWGIEATGYDEINGQLREALKSDEVTGIHLQVSSPGGEVDGLADTADAIFSARNQKPVTATIEDLGASAAYWLSSQAGTIRASRTTEVGSIGIYTVHVDQSKRAEELGFKVIVIKSGEHKGMGVPGAEITDTQIEAVQEVVNQIADSFISAVAAGRNKKFNDVKEWATGRLWIAKTAQKMGLIDTVTINNQQENNKIIKGVNSMDHEQELAEVKAREKVEKEKLAEVTAQAKVDVEKAAEEARKSERDNQNKRLMEFKAAFPDDLEFAMDACGRGLSVTEAKAERYDTVNKQLKETKEKASEKKEKVTGARPLSTEDTDSEASGDFMAEARQLVEDKKAKNLTQAMRKLARSNPALYEAFKEKCETVTKADYGEVAA